MKKLFIMVVVSGFVGATMMPTEAMARRGGSLKTSPKHHEFAASAQVVKKGSGKTRKRAPKYRLIKVHGVVVGLTLK